MIITFILVALAFLALGFTVWLTKGRAIRAQVLENPAEHISAVDVEAFRNLVDPAEEDFLRTHLAPVEFRAIQRERLRAAVEYVSVAAQNASVMLRLADAGRRSSDAATAEAAQKLVDNAIRLRLYALHAIPRLYLGMIIPGARISPVRIAERYEQMTRQVVLLGCLQYPTRGISAAL
jgi:hypothetical protein